MYDGSLPVELDTPQRKDVLGISIGSGYINEAKRDQMILDIEDYGYVRVLLNKEQALELGSALIRWAEEE